MSKSSQIIAKDSQMTSLPTSRDKPQQQRAAEKMRVILIAASQLFAEIGIEKTTTNLIADRAGVPVGSVYKYFKDKRAVIASVYELYVHRLTSNIEAIVDDPFMTDMGAGTVFEAFRAEWWSFLLLNRMDIVRQFLYSEPSWSDLALESDDRVIAALAKVVERIASTDIDYEIVATLIYRIGLSYEAIYRTKPDQSELYREYMNKAVLAIL
jgi:AcrR family transcriptional regulator